jgi:hypothetical protein
MNKKVKTPGTEISKVGNVANFEITDAATNLAARFGLNLADSKEARVDRAAQNMNRSMHCMVAAGLDLASLQADCGHGEFLALIEERGFEQTAAYRAINYTRFLLSRTDDERERLLSMPKSKVLALAGADSAVIDELLADGENSDLDDLSVRGLRQRIRELEAGTTDMAVQRDKAEADLKAAEKKLKRAARDEDDAHVPVVIADIRAELAALIKKAELAVQSMYPVGVEITGLGGHEEAGVWVEPTLRLGLAGLLSLRELVDGSIKSYAEAMGEKAKRLHSAPDALAFLDGSEVKAVAEDWARLTAAHQHEAALREHERAQAKPRGKGRPAKAPEAPAKA